jgi:PadR family transcriptional regulator, regulatory protein AphA
MTRGSDGGGSRIDSMSLPHAILGFLSVMPMTGYDLKTQAFDKTVAHFWPAVLPQIYRDLARLEASAFVESTVEVQQGKPNRRVYTITAAGREELQRWLTTFEAPLSYREPFLIQVFFGASVSNEVLLALLRSQRAAHASRLADLGAIDIPSAEAVAGEGADAVRWRALTGLTLDLGLRLEATYLAWLDHAIATVEELPSGSRAPRHAHDGAA